MKIDGRHAGNSPMAVLARLAGEVAYTQQRLCLRHEDVVQECLKGAAKQVKDAMDYLEQVERSTAQREE